MREISTRGYDRGKVALVGVGGGIRTLGHWNHNPALYQLSYTHRGGNISVYQLRAEGIKFG